MNDSFYQTCADIIGHEYVDFSVDPPVFSPLDIHACAELFRHLHSNGLSAAVRGGGSYPVPSAGKEKIVVSTSSMNDVRDVDGDDFVIVADAGVTIDKAVETAEIAGLTFPVDRLYGDRMTIGGLFMSGRLSPGMPDSMPFIRKVIGIKGITANGDIVTFGGRTRKNVTGYEVTRFLAGSMGLFMLATELIIAVQPTPDRRTVLRAEFISGSKALKTVKDFLQHMKTEPYMLEVSAPDGLGNQCDITIGYKGNRATVETQISKAAEVFERNGAETVSKMRDDKALKIRRRNVRNLAFTGMVSYGMPQPAVGTFLGKISSEAPSLPLHVYPLDGIVHSAAGNDMFDNKTFTDAVRAVGGKLPVQWHDVSRQGIGELLNAQEKAFMRSLKTELDPDGILNPHIGL